MATEPTTPIVTPLTDLKRRKAERQLLREAGYQKALQELHDRHQEERRALSQELRELAVGRKAIQDQLWADWISSSFPDLGPGHHDLTPEQQLKLSAELPRADRCVNVIKHHLDGGKERALNSRLATVVELGEEEAASKLKYLKKLSRQGNRRSSHQEDGASCSSLALNSKEAPGEGDEENPYWVESVLKASQQRDKEKQALLKEFLPAENDVRVDMQRLLEVLEEKELRKVFDYRIEVEDPLEIRARQRTVAARQVGMWRFVSKKKVEAKRKLVEQEGSAEADIAYVDLQKGHPRLPGCYDEIKNLLDSEENPVFSKVLQEWNRKEEMYSGLMEIRKNRLASMQNDVFQLIGSFTVFQGVVLTAVAQSSLLYCHNKWIPITLSVLASVISTGGVIQKFNQINDLQRNIDVKEREFTTAVQVGQQLRAAGLKGMDFFRMDLEIERNAYRELKSPERKRLAWLYFMPVLLFLVAFALLFPISFLRILCNPGSPPAANAQ